jgi:hypothetical protein
MSKCYVIPDAHRRPCVVMTMQLARIEVPVAHYLVTHSFCSHAIHVLCNTQTLVLLGVLLQRKKEFVVNFHHYSLTKMFLHVNNFFVCQWRWLVLNLWSCAYWSAVLTSRPPGQPADISVRTILELRFSCACRELTGAWLFALVVSTNSFSSPVILFPSYNLKGSDHGV